MKDKQHAEVIVTLQQADALIVEALGALNRASIGLTQRCDGRRWTVNMACKMIDQLVTTTTPNQKD